jgi:hypothetical protein
MEKSHSQSNSVYSIALKNRDLAGLFSGARESDSSNRE